MMRRHAIRALTLVELMVALVVVGIVSTAIATLIAGAANTNVEVNAMATSQWELELSLRRLIDEARVCQENSLSLPSSTTYPTLNIPGAKSFSFVTESDANNANATYIFSYYQDVTSPSDSTPALWERQDTNPPTVDAATGKTVPLSTAILVHNIQSFTVTQTTSNGHPLINITLTAGTGAPTTRTVSIAPRN